MKGKARFKVGEERSRYDQCVIAATATCFQLAEIMLVVAAFRFAAIRVDSDLLSTVAWILMFIGSAWLGLVIVALVRLLPMWTKLPVRLRNVVLCVVLVVAVALALSYMQVIADLAQSQT